MKTSARYRISAKPARAGHLSPLSQPLIPSSLTVMSTGRARGRSNGFLNSYECIVCKKGFCDNCSSKIPIYGILKESELGNFNREKWKTGEVWKELANWREVRYAHSPECKAKVVDDYRKALQNPLYTMREHGDKTWKDIWLDTLPTESAEHIRKFGRLKYTFWFSWDLNLAMNYLDEEAEAMHLERAGRYEEAASVYEILARRSEGGKYLDKARQAREKSKIVKVRETVVDINKLLEQVRDGGIVAVYRCPHCGGKVKVGKDTSVESLKVCEHCGSEIEAMELADFIRAALS